jgi:hypothetical protein
MGVQWFHTAWLLLGAPAIWLAATAGGGQRRWSAAIATTVYLFYAGMFTYNYSAWMVTPYAWAYAGIVRSLATGNRRWAVLAGVAAAIATLTIQRAVVVGPLAVVLWWLARRRGDAGGRPATLGWWIAGAVLGGAPLLGFYYAQGEASTLLHAVLPFATAGDYAASAVGKGAWASVQAVVEQLFAVFGLAMGLLVVVAIARVDDRRSDARELDRPTASWLFLLASIAGVSLGGARFYVHYLPQYVPALALMCGDTAIPGAFRRAFDRAARRRVLAVVVVFGAAFALLWAGLDVARGRADRYEGRPRRDGKGRTAAQLAGAHIQARTGPDDRVFVWGWSAWPTYYWADRRAPGRVYKPLGTLTTFNANTAFAHGTGMRLRDGAAPAGFIAEFDARPPAYVVVSRSFQASFGAQRDPLLDFIALEQRLQRDYILEREYDDLTVLRRVAKDR